ncbi:MAG: plsY [Gammaproteobacteria bacterium]|jgi:glycerol-3-phosphate acyltransferase PlsY|nr:plsY [Gammaproteobacteria bacterium]
MIYNQFATAFAIIIAYLFGSLSMAIIICKILHLPDPRSQGSGNPGATNVLRYNGKKVAAITLLGDVLKCVIPIVVAKKYGFNSFELALITFAAFLGHLYPIFFHFKGGKGVAPALGCWLALAWPMGLLLAVTWLCIAILTRYSSLAALITALLAPSYAWYFTNGTFAVMAFCMSLLLIYRHAKNIRNLYTGKETKIGKKFAP